VNPFRSWRIRTLDLVVLAWVVAWVGLGVYVGRDIHQLTALTRTVSDTGRALRDVTGLAGPLGSVPGLGSQVREIQGQSDQIQASGRSSGESVRELSVLLGIAVATAPTVPLLALFLPLRISQEREARAFRRAVRTGRADPAFEEFLARRAAQNLPYHRLRRISPNPWRDIEQGRLRPLADAELARVGVPVKTPGVGGDLGAREA
jgi:hypothetical protein